MKGDGMTQEELQKAYQVMIAVVANRRDGRRYVPIVKRLEQELANLQKEESDYERILRLAGWAA